MERLVVGKLVRSVFFRDRKGGPWEVPPGLRHERVAFEGNSGGRLAGLWFPAEAPKGVVVLAHPDKRRGKHWFVKEGWVEFLLRNGYDVLAFDFTGYGESLGKAYYFPEDVVAAARFAERWSGGLPVHVVGVSLGAFAVANAAPHLRSVASLVLESPYPSYNAWYGRGPFRLAMDAFDRAFPRTAALIQADRNMARAAVPRILVVLAEDDRVTPPALTEAVARAAPAGTTELLRLPGVGHLEGFGRSAAYRERLLRTLGAAREASTDPPRTI